MFEVRHCTTLCGATWTHCELPLNCEPSPGDPSSRGLGTVLRNLHSAPKLTTTQAAANPTPSNTPTGSPTTPGPILSLSTAGPARAFSADQVTIERFPFPMPSQRFKWMVGWLPCLDFLPSEAFALTGPTLSMNGRNDSDASA